MSESSGGDRQVAEYLYEQGRTFSEISRELGRHYSVVRRWLDTDFREKALAGSREYKERSRGTCKECGASTSGCNGPDHSPEICRSCFAARNKERNARLIEMWEAGKSARAIGKELDLAPGTVQTWVDKYRERYGLQYRMSPDRENWDVIERLWNQGLRSREIAERIGSTPNRVSAKVQAMRLASRSLPRRHRVRETSGASRALNRKAPND